MPLERLPSQLFDRVCAYLSLADWLSLAVVSSRCCERVAQLWRRKCTLSLDSDAAQLNPAYLPRFYAQQDTQWPQRDYKDDSAIRTCDLPAVYPEVSFLLNQCAATVEEVVILSKVPNGTNTNPLVGRSFFRLIWQRVYPRLTRLDLSGTAFALTDLEDARFALPSLAQLLVRRCCIYVSRGQILAQKPERSLRRALDAATAPQTRLSHGCRLFLAVARRAFGALRCVDAAEAQFRSTGCVIYCYGYEAPVAVYTFRRQEDIDDEDGRIDRRWRARCWYNCCES